MLTMEIGFCKCQDHIAFTANCFLGRNVSSAISFADRRLIQVKNVNWPFKLLLCYYTIVTPANLSRDFVAQLYHAT